MDTSRTMRMQWYSRVGILLASSYAYYSRVVVVVLATSTRVVLSSIYE